MRGMGAVLGGKEMGKKGAIFFGGFCWAGMEGFY